MWSDHERIEERSLALHEEIARRIQSNPRLLEQARRNLNRWIEQSGQTPVWDEWNEILDGTLSEVLEVLRPPGERGRRLRQSSPFCGILTQEERWKIYESFTIRAYYQGSGEHRR